MEKFEFDVFDEGTPYEYVVVVSHYINGFVWGYDYHNDSMYIDYVLPDGRDKHIVWEPAHIPVPNREDRQACAELALSLIESDENENDEY